MLYLKTILNKSTIALGELNNMPITSSNSFIRVQLEAIQSMVIDELRALEREENLLERTRIHGA